MLPDPDVPDTVLSLSVDLIVSTTSDWTSDDTGADNSFSEDKISAKIKRCSKSDHK